MRSAKKTCLFAHYNEEGKIARYVVYYLQSLSALGYSIIFISNSPVAADDKRKLLQQIPDCSVFEKENKGNDFGAWSWAFSNNLIPHDTDDLLLTNDSVFGPLFDLRPIFEQMQGQADFWGMTESYQGGWHIQSFFLNLSRKVFTSDAFRNVLMQDFAALGKKDIIATGEIFLSTSLNAAGFTGAAFIRNDEFIQKSNGELHNPTHFFWEELIRDHGFPFVKKDLVTRNPEELPNAIDTFSVIAQVSKYDISQIIEVFAVNVQPVEQKSKLRPMVICHLYFPDLALAMRERLLVLRSYNAFFVFNISSVLRANEYYIKILQVSFPGCVIINAPNQGRDIGGKLFALDVALRLSIESDITLFIHDKKSLHLGHGSIWRDELFRIIEKDYLPQVFQKFEQDGKIGIVGAQKFVQNEFIPATRKFSCTSNQQIHTIISKYNIRPTSYEFIAGNIFWIKTGLLKEFFKSRPLLQIRSELEKGNALDFGTGTFIHSWERIMSWIASEQGHGIYGL